MARRGGERGDRTSRREFLETVAVAAAGALVGCGGGTEGGADGGGPLDAALDAPLAVDAGPPAVDAGADAGPPPVEPPEGTPEVARFGLGIASGDVTDTHAIVWARYDGFATLGLTVWEMEGETYARTVHSAIVAPADGGFAHVDVPGLRAGARYRYAFFELLDAARTGRSAVGRFRAALAPDATEPLKLGAVSCTRNGRSFSTIERAAAQTDLDAFLLLGDTTYNDGASTVAEYRAKWAENLATAGYRGLRAATSVVATWDDHEVDNDFDPERVDTTAARQVFFENLPVRRMPPPDEPIIWRSLRWGLTAELFVLDCRGERLPSTRGGTDTYLSRRQMDWLKAGLVASPAAFKLIMNSVPITDFPLAFDVARGDRWEGYPTQRTEILRHIDDNAVRGVLWISGDFHLASMGRVSTSGPGATQSEVLVGPGAQNGNLLAATLGGPQFDWATSSDNYAMLELDPARALIRVWYYDASGSVMQTGEFMF